ncbi:follicle-stimulating hormone receptor-like isoform X2 [Portunus trituberculatus]|uniref:follicle-stimulating hormone receptor-like isoform X2 n=1 Tax=Portunus trituberculatus TaxID=210409 RepID=UPI001E1D1F87|nr:follicle-stimulating hormone receptor-like isoform X2 [Portunus trituberculatus]
MALLPLLLLLILVPRPSPACPAPCSCLPAPAGVSRGVGVVCAGLGLIEVPLQLEDGREVVYVDLSNNELSDLPDLTFANYSSLLHLRLSGNRISNIANTAFHRLQLKELYLDNNLLASLPDALPTSLLRLSLEDNYFTTAPATLASLQSLQELNLARNKIKVISAGDFRNLSHLLSLSLHQNQLEDIEDGAFKSLQALQVLDLTENSLKEVPGAVLSCLHLTRLLLGHNRVAHLGETAFSGLRDLQQVTLQGNPITTVHPAAFTNLPSLTKLILKEIRGLSQFPHLNGSKSLEMIRIDRASLTALPPSLCSFVPALRSLNLHLNAIKELPDLTDCAELRLLDLSDNAISSLGHASFRGAPLLQDLLLQDNRISHVPADAFVGLSSLQVLDLQRNQILEIEEDAFLPLVSLEDINLGDNHFPRLPHVGLQHVVSIKVHNNRHLRVFPGPDSFPKVHSLVLSYAYHCCPFLSIEEDVTQEPRIGEDVIFNISWSSHPGLWNVTDGWRMGGEEEEEDALRNYTHPHPGRPPPPQQPLTTPIRPQCIPLPGPFMPCRDLFDWWTLRCGVWIVFLLALMGNGVVVVVLVAAYAKMDVPRFLVTNLALADFFMGVYLGFLAVADASTLGEFRMYAIPWQMSAGCQVAGFLGVLSSELSVYTLAVITLERNYAITHAMHLQKRLSLRQAAYIMAAGWVFALTMAVLPLAGVSDYRKFAVCLPFETAGPGLGYVVFLMFINGVAFLILMGCYFKIYCAIRGSQAWNSNDSRIAKRMALLVFTDLVCWAPIAFFSLTSAFDLHLISLEEAKVFTVFILPLNSCCNPFLYALLTKQFKKDCVMLCKTIEESRVTRGIGRCRHSSNFSNRQTPANTNSAVDHTSQGDGKPPCGCRFGKQEKRRRPRLSLAALKHLLCQRGATTITSSSDGSFQADAAARRGPRHASLSSDTCSGSWSDTWRRGRGGATLPRAMDRRRHNSWSASHRPSQESSLSASRPDSAASASTATWRISRSSVSSDTSNSSGRARGGEVTAAPRRCGRGAGPPRQLSQGALIPAMRPPTGRAKPRLTRQTAVEREAYTPGREGSVPDSPPCPLHLRPDQLSCVYEQSHEDDPVPAPPLLLDAAALDDSVFADSSDDHHASPPASPPAPDHARAQDATPATYTEASEITALVPPLPAQAAPLETHFPLEERRPLI